MTLPDLGPALHAERALPRSALGSAWAGRTADGVEVMAVALAADLVALVPDRARLVDALRTRVQADASASATLLPLLDVVVAPDGRVVLLMPLEERASAADRLAQGKTFATTDVADALRTLAIALDEAHAAGARHGAIGMGLVYLGGDRPARLAGMGVADAFVDAGAERPALLAALGARRVAAPEVAGLPGAVDSVGAVAADMHGLGATLYACMTGRPPFGGRTTSLTMATVLADEGLSGDVVPVPRGTSAEQVAHAEATERLAQALLRAVERAPADRWPSMARLVRALDAGATSSAATPQGQSRHAAPIVDQAPPAAARRAGCASAVVLVAGLAGLAAVTLARVAAG